MQTSTPDNCKVTARASRSQFVTLENLTKLALWWNEPDWVFLDRHWRKHPLDMLEQDADLPVVLRNFPGQFIIGRKNLAEADEGAHDSYVDLDSFLALEDGR